MKKEKKNKSKVLKIILIAVLVVVLLLILQHVIITLTKKKVTLEQTDASMVVKYTIADEKESEGYNTIIDVLKDADTSIIYNSYGFETLKKVGDNYEGTISNANEILKDQIVDYIFAKRNTFGEVISDAKYDTKTKKLTIPKKYFEDENESIQMQVLVKSTSDKIINTKVKTEIKNGTTKEKVQTLNGFDTETTLSIDDYDSNKKIDKSDIDIYVNDKYKISKNEFKYDKNSKTISMQLNPMLADKIEVVVNKSSILSNVIESVSAHWTGNAVTTNTGKEIELDGEPDLNEGATGSWLMRWYYGEGYPTEKGSGNSYLNKTNPNDVPFSGSKCGSDFSNCPERQVVEGVIKNKSNVIGFPTTGAQGLSKDTYTSLKDPSNKNYQDPTKDNFIIEEQNESEKNGDVDFAFRIDPGFLGQNVKIKYPNSKFNVGSLWVAAYCLHITANANNATYNYSETVWIEYRVLYKRDNVMILQLMLPKDAAAGGQNGYGVYKFVWEDAAAKIQVKKQLIDVSGNDITDTFNSENDYMKNGVIFGLYSDSNCNNLYDTGYSEATGGYENPAETYQTGLVEFGNLKTNTEYYVKELGFTEDSPFNTDEWSIDSSCQKVVVTSGNAAKDDTGARVYVHKIKNNQKPKYCLKVKKVDASDKKTLSGISFKLKNATTGEEFGPLTTDSTGIVTFSNLKKNTGYTIEETSHDKTLSTSTGLKYWNNNKMAEVIGNEATQMVDKECPANAVVFTKEDSPVYYCSRVKKVDHVNQRQTLSGSIFENQNNPGYKQYNSAGEQAATKDDGYAYFFNGKNSSSINVRETTAPDGYQALSNSVSLPSVELPVSLSDITTDGTYDESKIDGKKFVSECNKVITEEVTSSVTNDKLLLNWYKDTENKTPAKDAKFKVSIGEESNKKYVKVTDKQNQTDANGVTKSCYVYAGLTSNENEASTLLSDTNGEVCISRVSKGTYTVTETNPSKYHTFGKNANKKINAITVFGIKDSSEDSANNTNRFVNYDTEFEFTKTVSSGDEEDIKIIINGKEKTLKDLTTEELMKLEFNVYDSNNNLVSFILKDGIYEYSENDVDGNAGDKLTGLHLDNTRKIKIHHLPVGTYSIKEKNSNTCEASSNYSECVGYYYPEYKEESSYKFTINNCSNSNASACGNGKYEISKQQLENKPTEITFTKKDYYSYYDAADKNKSDENVDFVDAKERNDFDKIVFKLKDENGKYLTLKKVRDIGDCTSDSSYSEYRYVSSDQTDSNGTELHACGGHIKITNLCRGKKYTMEEISVPEGSVYVKENTTNTPTSVEYKIPCTSGDTTHNSTTNIIKDKPTRVRFEKRDSKYNYLINDETTTFEVYKCKKNEKCHPGNYTTKEEREKNGMTLVKFSKRAVIAGDEEDPNDEAGLSGVEVYKKISDSDAKKGASYVTELHPYNGILVLRYLEADYNYVLLETVAPKNYTLPEGVNAETSFTVTSTTVKVDEVDVPNKPTSLLIRKYSDDGELLEGAEFKVYEGTTCDANLSAMNQPKTLLKLKTIRDGVYENRPEKDTDTIKTCTDREDAKCSDIPVNDITKLTYVKYLGTWSEFENTENTKNEKVEIKQGEALIQYLEYGHCYIIEEVKAPKGYSLPKKEEDRYTMVTIEANKDYIADTYKELVNKPTPFTFYKYDEYNKLLDGAEFKLQKLDDNKKYHDVTVTKEVTENGFYYKADSNTTNTKIETKNGSATVYYLEEGQYRIVETKAAPGKELNKNPNVATFFVDGSGNVYGNSIIVNKGKTEKIEIKSSSSAELIVSIQTGQTVIKYGLIISILVALISLLMILKKKAK